jgi:signal peptidase I
MQMQARSNFGKRALRAVRWIGTALKGRRARALIASVTEPLAAVLVVFLSTTAIAQPFYVPSGSMEPTLQIGDALIASKFPYGYSRYSIPWMPAGAPSTQRLFPRMPAVGDVAIFRLTADPSTTFIKRVIGLPGDRIQMRDGRLWVNGHELLLRRDGTGKVEMGDGSVRIAARYIETFPNGREHAIYKLRAWGIAGLYDDTRVYIVPAGHLFMIGDNRDDSCDSRFPIDECGVGYVPVGNLVGRAEIVVGSYDYLNAHAFSAWLSQLRLSRLFSRII